MLLVAAACSDDTGVTATETLATSELLFLRQQANAPAPATTRFFVVNARETRRRVLHPDPFNNPYAEVVFPAGSLESLNGAPIGPGDSVEVTVQPRSGEYGLVLSPGGLEFSAAASPTATFFYGRYGDLSVADASATYPDASAYAAALDLWAEVNLDRWRRTTGTGPSGTDAVTGRLSEAGVVAIAAPR